MYLYRLVGEVLICGYDAQMEEIEDYHIVAVNVLWPDRLSKIEVAGCVVRDLLRGYGFIHAPSWVWSTRPTVTEITDPALLRAAGVPESLIEEPDHV